MNPARSGPLDYINFLVAAQKSFTCSEAARCQPETPAAPAHDAFTRLLRRQPPDTEALWQETRGLAQLEGGVLVLDDTTLDKPYARKMELVTRHWSGKHRRVVSGINLLTLLWSGGGALIPCDFRIYDKPLSGKNKNDYFREMLDVAHARGFQPGHILFDSWYSSLENLKKVRNHEWVWLTQFRANRRVNPDGQGNVRLDTVEIPPEGRQVHLRGYGLVKVFRTDSPNGDVEHWATNSLTMTPQEQDALKDQAWGIENYHRGLKQCCGVEKCQARKAQSQRNHIGMAIQAFLRLEVHRLRSGVSWYEAVADVVRSAIRQYLAQPLYSLNSTA
jgi:hypothetical protein